MGKGVVLKKNSGMPLAKTSKIKKAQSNPSGLERSKEKYAQFFEFLKGLHGSERRENQHQIVNDPLVKEVTSLVMQFFNQQKNYNVQDLERYVIYLANLLNILRDEEGSLSFQGEFKTKIRKFLGCMVQARMEGKSKNSKIQALLYILAILIYKERVNIDHSIRNINRSIYSDRSLVKLLLSLSLSKYKKMSKFYGVIMMYLSNQQISGKVKQGIIKSIFMNISKVDHEPTFLNFLQFLRSEKNKVKLNYHDILDGQIFEMLIEAYPKYADQYQSYYILDYMYYLLMLFPALASKIPIDNFIQNVLTSLIPANLHHPLQESTIVCFVQTTLKYAESNAKNIILNQIIKFSLENRNLTPKLAHLLLEHDLEEKKMMQLLEEGYFESFWSSMHPNISEGQMRKSIEMFNKAISKFERINKQISEYMRYGLNCRLKIIQEAKKRLAENVNQDQN